MITLGITFIASVCTALQKSSIKTLSLMVEHYQNRSGILEACGFPPILDLLTSEYAIVQELALQTLHSCLHNSKSYCDLTCPSFSEIMLSLWRWMQKSHCIRRRTLEACRVSWQQGLLWSPRFGRVSVVSVPWGCREHGGTSELWMPPATAAAHHWQWQSRDETTCRQSTRQSCQ